MAEKRPRKLKRLAPKKTQGSTLRILYVEDSAVIRDTIPKLLELKGYDVNYAKNGREGLEKALSWHPDVVLMDLRMPVMDGFQAITAIKRNPKTSHLPVFVVSAWSGNKERTQAKLAGADAFFVKPPDLDKLIETINQIANASS